jgi:hypothetical protein
MSTEKTVSVEFEGGSRMVSFFLDDSIATVRQKVGLAVGVHPDRLRIYVEGSFPKKYYAWDSRKWEALFLRLSPRGESVTPAAQALYTPFEVPLGDKMHWMSADAASDEREASGEIHELRILGVPENQSYIFPLDNTDPPLGLPERPVLPEMSQLFQTMHPYPILRFYIVGFTQGLKASLQMHYYPSLRDSSPAYVSDEVAGMLQKETTLLRTLADMRAETPTKTTILRARWKLSWVNTDFGDAVRNRFEQLFYSQTVDAKNLPVVSYFTSKREVSRHKFFTDSKHKKPSLDMKLWNAWWTASKPVRNRPSLVFFRGTSRTSYDRITITSADAILTSYRSAGDVPLDKMQKSLKEWILSLDSLHPFLDKRDTADCRWDLLDTSVKVHYVEPFAPTDFARFECVRSLFEIVNKDDLAFKFLRSDQADVGFSSEELRVLSMLKENPSLSADDIDLPDGAELLATVKERIEDDPDILSRQLTELPLFRISKNDIVAIDVHDVPRTIRYMSILRHILADASDELDEICPRKKESAQEVAALVKPAEEADVEFDFLADIEESVPVVASAAAAPEPEEAPKKVKAKSSKPESTYGYFGTRLQEFDESVYSGNYSSKCEQERQPVVFTPADVARTEGTPYTISTYDPKYVLENEAPAGTFLCPKFWCTKDRIPLREEDLIVQEDGKQACPVCKGKVFAKGDVLSDAPVIARESKHVFPGFMKKFLPSKVACCFTTDQTSLVKQKLPSEGASEISYILSEIKELGSLRIGYIPQDVVRALRIPETYAPFIATKNRLQAGQSGFFRVGLGRPAKTLPKLLGVETKPEPPARNPEILQRCEFFRMWKGEGTGETLLEKQINGISAAYEEESLEPQYELEYVARLLDCDVFSLHYDGQTVEVGCRFGGLSRLAGMRRAIILLTTPTTVDYIAHVTRPSKVPRFHGNVHPGHAFPADTFKVLKEARENACSEDPPTIADASKLWIAKGSPEPLFVVMDPYRRAQALFVPKTLLIPFRPTSQYTSLDAKTILHGYSDIRTEDLPTQEQIRALFEHPEHKGFVYQQTLLNVRGEQVEGILASGLRVLFQPETTEDRAVPKESLATVRDMGENLLAHGEENAAVSKEAKAILYEAEVFDFLLFQLSHDIQKEDYIELREALLSRSLETLREPLQEWFDNTVKVYDIADPPTFVKKMRSPCSQDACNGNICAFDGATCKVKVHEVRPSLEKTKLFRRLLSVLVSNQKTWAIVVEHRVSPFFSTMLYVELPHEVILTDLDADQLLK